MKHLLQKHSKYLWLSLLLLLVGATAIAIPKINGINGINDASVAKIGDTEYATLQAAVDAAQNGETVTLFANTTENVVVPVGKDITLSIDKNVTLSGGGSSNKKAAIENKGTLTIKGSGTIKREDTAAANGDGQAAYYVILNNGTMTISGVTVTNDSGPSVEGGKWSGSSLICNGTTNTSPSLKITGGTYTQNNFIVIKNDDYGTLNITGGTFNSKDQAVQNWNTTTITGGTFNGDVKSWAWEGNGAQSNPTISINGGTFNNCEIGTAFDGTPASNSPTLAISKGTFNNCTLEKAEGSELTISGGTFNGGSDPTEYGYEPSFMVTKADGTISYASLTTISAAGTYKLLKDVELYRIGLTTNMDKITIDLNGHTLAQVSGYTSFCLLYATKSITVNEINIIDTSAEKGGKIIANTGGNAVAAISIGKQVSNTTVNIGEGVTIEGNTVLIEGTNNTLNVEGTINGGNDFAVCTNGSTTTNATINIKEGAVLTSTGTAVYLPGTGTTTIVEGASITGATGVYVKSGTLNITGGEITGNGAAAEFEHNGNGANATGDALVVENCDYPGGAPVVSVTGGKFTSTNAAPIGSYAQEGYEPLSNFVIGGYFNKELDAALCTTGKKTVPSATMEGYYELGDIVYVAQIGEVKYESLADAVAAVPTDGTETTITMLADASSSRITVDEGKKVTIDFAGFTVTPSEKWLFINNGDLTFNNTTTESSGGVVSEYKGIVDNYGKLTVNGGTYSTSVSDGIVFWNNNTTSSISVTGGTVSAPAVGIVTEAGTISITGGTVSATGETSYAIQSSSSTVNVSGGTVSAVTEAIHLESSSTATISGDAVVKVTGESTWGIVVYSKSTLTVQDNATIQSNGFAISGNGSAGQGETTINIEGGTITGGDAGIYQPQSGSLNITGGTITGATGVYVKSGELSVTGGEINGTGAKADYNYNGNGADPTGDALVIDNCGYPGGVPVVSVTGGKFTSTNAAPIGSYAQEGYEPLSNFVSGGYFNKELDADLCATGKKTAPSTTMTGYYEVVEIVYVAQIGDVKYETLGEAFTAAANGSTITLLTDVELTDRLFVNAGATPAYAGTNNRYATTSEDKSITLDLNGNNITSSSNIALAGGSLNIVNNGTADATHGVISTSNSGLAPIEVRGTGDLTSKRTLTIGENVTLKGGEYGLNIFGSNDAQKNIIEVTVNGKVEGDLFVLGNLTNDDNNILITVNGSVDASGIELGAEKAKTGIALNGNAKVVVNENASVKGETAIEVRAGELTVNGGTITATSESYSYTANNSGTTVKGAAIAIAPYDAEKDLKVTVSDGTLSGAKTIAVVDVQNNLEKVTVKAKDDFVDGADETVIPESYKWVSDGEGMSTLTPRDPIAKIGETVYYSLAAAVAAVPTDGTETTIELLANVTENVVVKDGKNIVLELGGKTVTGYIDQYDSNITLTNGNLAGTFYVNGGPSSAEAGYNKFTLAADATITSDWGFILYQGPNGNDAYGSTIDINGTINGTAWVMGNITEGNSVINVNSGAKIDGDVFGLNGLATLNVKAGATIIGAETGIEVRAGNLNVEGGTITSTSTEYKVESNGSGTTTYGAAIAVAQHTTGLPINANITGGTLSGLKTISVADPEGKNYEGVTVKAADALANAETVIIPEGYKWVSDGTMSTLTPLDPVAKIGETVYYSLADAIAAVPTDGSETTITMIANETINNNAGVTIAATQNVVLDLNGFTVSQYAPDARVSHLIENLGTLTIKDSSDTNADGTGTGKLYSEASQPSSAYGYATNLISNRGQLTIKSGYLESHTRFASYVIDNYPGGNAVIDGGHLYNYFTSAIRLFCNSTTAEDNVTVNGGIVEGYCTIWMQSPNSNANKGNLTINGGTFKTTEKAVVNGEKTVAEGDSYLYMYPSNANMSLTITGGEFDTNIANWGDGTINISGGTFNGWIYTDTQEGFITGGYFIDEEAAELDEAYVAEGYISVPATDKPGYNTVVNEDDYVFELIDQTVYELGTEKTFKHVTYTRTFNNIKWQSLFVPFDINVEDYADEYEFAKIHMIALENDEEGFTSSNKIRISYTKVTEGKLYANKPYLIRAKSTGTKVFVLDNVTLKSSTDITPIVCSTTHADYSIVGSYQSVTATAESPFMAMAGGTINWYESSTIKPYRWVIRVSPKGDNYARPSIEIVEEDEATSISSVIADPENVEGYYTVNGVRNETPVKGINIVRYKNGQTKKVVIK